MYKWFFAWRYLHTRLVALFGILAVTLCVAMVLVVLSVMGGFLDTLRAHARSLLSDIVVSSGTLQGWPYYEEFADYLEAELPDIVVSATPAIQNYGLLRVPLGSYTKTVQVTGIKLDEYREVNGFGKSLYYDKYYPGTTHLGLQEQPLAGWIKGQRALPLEFEEANQRWRAAETDPRQLAKYDSSPFEPWPFEGARVFEMRLTAGDDTLAPDALPEDDTGPEGPGWQGPPWPGIIIGNDVINRRAADGAIVRVFPRGVQVTLTVLAFTETGNILSEQPVRLALRYADDSQTGVYNIDCEAVYVDFDLLQDKLAMTAQQLEGGARTRPRTTQLLVDVNDEVDIDVARDRIQATWDRFFLEHASEFTDSEQRVLSFVGAMTWEDMQRPLIAAVEKEKVLVTLLFAIISLVTIVLIGCIFYMIVKNKTRDIGVLKAIGASGMGIAVMFIFYAGFVGIVGSILGTAAGSAFVWNINDFQDLLVKLHPSLKVWDPTVYTFDRIPSVVKFWDAFWIGIAAVISSMVGALIPAFLAARVWPVQALRYE